MSAKLATAVLGLVVQKFAPGFGDRILLGIDDSPPPGTDGMWLHYLDVELLAWFMQSPLALGGKAKVWLAADGAYATRPFLLPVMKMGIVVVSRLGKDACLFDLPGADAHGNRIYGKNQLSLAKRAGHREGWEPITYPCRGVEVTQEYKTFLATSKLVSAQIRVVVVRLENGSWAPYFCTDPSAEVRDILEGSTAGCWARRSYLWKKGVFHPVYFSSEASGVDDDAQLSKLVVLHYDASGSHGFPKVVR